MVNCVIENQNPDLIALGVLIRENQIILNIFPHLFRTLFSFKY